MMQQPIHRFECQHTHKLNCIVSPERGVQVWCKICKAPEWVSREQVLAALLTEEEKRVLLLRAAPV